MFRHIVLGAAACLALTAAAEATPRDEMLSGISRCGGIADERTFLDCVYGAAQPVRAELGLPPAPATQIRLVPGFGAASVPLPSVAATTAATAPAPAPERESRGGFFSFLDGKTITRATPMTSYSFDHDHHFVVTVAGRKWRQDLGDTRLADWHKPASTYVATITTGLTSVDKLNVAGETGFYSVVPVR